MASANPEITTDDDVSTSVGMPKIQPTLHPFMEYWTIAPYHEVKKTWPSEGKHILAQFDAENIYVYQAFNSKIAEFAVKNQKFGGPDYQFTRMSWIKTNFLWMMYRSGWASKKGQERILAIQIPRKYFELILSQAFIPSQQKAQGVSQEDLQVRLQWDPDHSPSGGGLSRRAIQLGLKNDILKHFATDWLTRVIDVTPFVDEMRGYAKSWEQLYVAQEEVYPLADPDIVKLIGLSSED